MLCYAPLHLPLLEVTLWLFALYVVPVSIRPRFAQNAARAK
jgi:hypothetical protein